MMRILVTGATGFIGNGLLSYLDQKGHHFTILTRNFEYAKLKLSSPCKIYQWNIEDDHFPMKSFEGVDALIHLAGEPVGKGRWTASKKERIRNSRILGTHQLRLALQKATHHIKIFVGASAIGYYGDHDNQELTENATAGTDFLADICKEWEYELTQFSSLVEQTAIMRIGVVLGARGGVLKKLLPIFKLCLGGPAGAGNQWMSWIHYEDIIRLLAYPLESPDVRGVINGVAPNPVTNREFSTTLGKVLHRPSFFPTPEWILKPLLGEMSSLILSSQRVIPKQAKGFHFQFKYPDLEKALNNTAIPAGHF